MYKWSGYIDPLVMKLYKMDREEEELRENKTTKEQRNKDLFGCDFL
jgi:hypothetical protein